MEQEPTIEEEPKFHFGGIDFYGIESSEIKLPQNMPMEGDLIDKSYIENIVVPFIENQVKDNKYYRVRGNKYSIGNRIFIIVDASDQEPEKLYEDVKKIEKQVPDLSVKNKDLFAQWEKELEHVFELDRSGSEDYEENYKELNRIEEKIRQEFNRDKEAVDNIKEIIKSGAGTDLSEAIFLCHWTPKDDIDIVKLLEAFILHPDSEIRNNASRSILYNYTHELDKVDIHKFLKQMQLPFHTDRNKALYVLEAYSKQPRYLEELLKYKRIFEKFSKAKMPNIAQPAKGILENITR